jgi:predicted ATPase
VAGYLRIGKAEVGLAAVSKAFGAAARKGERLWAAELWRLKGELLLLPPVCDEAEAESCFQRAMDTARGQSAKSLELRAATSLARLYARPGKLSLARGTLTSVLGWFSEGRDTADIREATSALQEIG